jgi:hypothetical protein
MIVRPQTLRTRKSDADYVQVPTHAERVCCLVTCLIQYIPDRAIIIPPRVPLELPSQRLRGLRWPTSPNLPTLRLPASHLGRARDLQLGLTPRIPLACRMHLEDLTRTIQWRGIYMEDLTRTNQPTHLPVWASFRIRIRDLILQPRLRLSAYRAHRGGTRKCTSIVLFCASL